MAKNKPLSHPALTIIDGSSTITTSSNINLNSDGSLNITASKVAIDGHIDTVKISKLIHILCAGDIEKIKTVIEADIDRELSNNLISINSFDESYLIHLFKVYLQTFPNLTYNDQNTEIFETIAKKISKRSYIVKCEAALDGSVLKISHPTIHAEIKRSLNKIKELLPNSIDFIKEDEDEKRSEMVKKLVVHLSELNARAMPYEDLAKLFIKLIEDQGMLPPSVKLQKLDTVDNRYWESEE